jgi:hypothetical protein
MRPKFIRFGAMLILTLCLLGHVAEIFDHWDNTLETGNDTEYSTIIVALIAGAVLGLARIATLALGAVPATFDHLCLFVATSPSSPNPVVSINSSPPLSLKI